MSFAELSAFMNERDDRAEAKAEKARQEAKAEKADLKVEMAAMMEAVEAKLEQQREDAEAKLEHQRQLAALPVLQARLQSLHTSKLLTDDELYTLEDVIADSLEGEAGGRDELAKLVLLSERMVGDAALARQLRRKFA